MVSGEILELWTPAAHLEGVRRPVGHLPDLVFSIARENIPGYSTKEAVSLSPSEATSMRTAPPPGYLTEPDRTSSLHFVPDAADPVACVRRLRDAVGPGSYLAIVHATQDGQPPEVLEAQKMSGRTSTEIVLRTGTQIGEYFEGLTVVDPGPVHLPLWRPDSPSDVGEHPELTGAYGGVGRKE